MPNRWGRGAGIALALVALSVAVSAQSQTGGRLAYTPAAGWVPVTVTSMMRVGEFSLPKTAGDAEDASLIIYFFGGTGGTVQANIDRWLGHISQPDGRPTKDVAKITRRLINGLSVSEFDASGTFVAEVTPGSTERHNKPGYRLRAAVVETPRGPYFVRVVGPSATVARWATEIEAFFQSLSFSSTASRPF